MEASVERWTNKRTHRKTKDKGRKNEGKRMVSVSCGGAHLMVD